MLQSSLLRSLQRDTGVMSNWTLILSPRVRCMRRQMLGVSLGVFRRPPSNGARWDNIVDGYTRRTRTNILFKWLARYLDLPSPLGQIMSPLS